MPSLLFFLFTIHIHLRANWLHPALNGTLLVSTSCTLGRLIVAQSALAYILDFSHAITLTFAQTHTYYIHYKKNIKYKENPNCGPYCDIFCTLAMRETLYRFVGHASSGTLVW